MWPREGDATRNDTPALDWLLPESCLAARDAAPFRAARRRGCRRRGYRIVTLPLSPIPPMFTGEQVASLLDELGVTHAVTVPDSTLGQWQGAIVERGTTRLVRVCREGEAWGIAAGLWLGGATPVVMIQCTGLFESGDALRNVLHDWKLPIFSFIGYRSYLNQEHLPGDTCLVFTEPILDAWRIDYRLITEPGQLGTVAQHYRHCRAEGRPGAALIAEGRS